MTAFTDFLRDEMARRDFESQRAFSRWLGMSAATVWQVMDGGREPGLDFLLATAKATGVDIRTLIDLAYPGAQTSGDLSAADLVLAQQISQLPDEIRRVVRAIIRGSVERDTTQDQQ
jgi:transcriptional regulator with XRE-family HTH domain